MSADGYPPYSLLIEWDPRDGIFVATVPELPGCRTHGDTYEEAVREGRDAIASWVDAAVAWGREVPPPRTFTGAVPAPVRVAGD